MGIWPADQPQFGEWCHLTPFCRHSVGAVSGSLGIPAGATDWPSANRAYYIPFRIGVPHLIKKFFWRNGTSLSGNGDMGIYDVNGVRICRTGSTALSGTSAAQEAVPLEGDTLIGPGTYYLAMSRSAAGGRVFKSLTTTNIGRLLGILQQASAFPLPATFTPAALTASPHVFVGGATTRTVV